MYVKEVLDDLGIRIKLPQHWYSTDVGAEFEEPKLIQNVKTVGEWLKLWKWLHM